MKFSVLLLFATFVVFNVFAQVPDISSIFQNFFEKARCQFQNGFSSLDIPSLDPFQLPNYETSLGTVGNLTDVNIAVSNLAASGLSNFQITKFEISLQQASLTVGVTIPFLTLVGSQKTTAGLNNQNLVGSGILNVSAKNIHIEYTNFFGIFPIKILSTIYSNVSIDEVIAVFDGFGSKTLDDQVSENLSLGTPIWVQSNLAQLNQELQNAFINFSNQRLINFPDINSIFNAITGGGA